MEGSSKIILEHYHSLPSGVRQILNFDLSSILTNLKARKVVSYSRSGRFKLIKKRFKEARADYRKALTTGNPLLSSSWKLRSLVGLALSYFRMDVEGLAKFMRKKSYK